MTAQIIDFAARASVRYQGRPNLSVVDSVNMSDVWAYDKALCWVGCRAIVVLGRETGRRGLVVGASSFSPGMVLLSGEGRTLAVHCGSLALETGDVS